MGEYRHTIDKKGRIIIPAKYRDKLGSIFYVTRGLEGCLYIYSDFDWNNMMNTYKSVPDSKEKRAFMRLFLSGAVDCEIDTQGRINIPKPLVEFAKLEKECLIVGVDDHIEIWSKDNWDLFINSEEENLSDLADKLFVNKIS